MKSESVQEDGDRRSHDSARMGGRSRKVGYVYSLDEHAVDSPKLATNHSATEGHVSFLDGYAVWRRAEGAAPCYNGGKWHNSDKPTAIRPGD